MGIFDQAKVLGNLMKNMSPSQMKEIMERAKESQKMLEEQIRRVVDEEIKKRGLISRREVEEILRKGLRL